MEKAAKERRGRKRYPRYWGVRRISPYRFRCRSDGSAKPIGIYDYAPKFSPVSSTSYVYS